MGRLREGTNRSVMDVFRRLATQAQAEAGTDNLRSMSPLRTKQAIDALGAGGSGLVFLSSQLISTGVSAVEFTSGIDSTYETYRLFINNLTVVTDDVQVWMRVSNDGGVSYESGASDYAWGFNQIYISSDYRDGDAADSEINMMNANVGASMGNAAGEHANLVIDIKNPANSGIETKVHFHGDYDTADGNLITISGGAGSYNVAETVDAFQILAESGNIDGGRFTLFGVTHS